MKIAYLSNSIIPSRYANSVHVMKMCQAFAKNGHDITLFARFGQVSMMDDFSRYGVSQCFNICKSWRPKMLFSKKVRLSIYNWQIRRKINSGGSLPELLYGRDINAFRTLAGLGIPMIYESHFAPKDTHDLTDFEYVFRSPNFKRLVVISNALARQFSEIFPWLPQEKILVAHDGADIPTEDSSEVANWPGDKNRLQAGYVGHLYPGKGMEIIAEIAPLAPNVDFHIVGGMSKDIKYWQQKCKVDNLHFHGHVDHGKLGGYFRHFDVVLAPYLRGKVNDTRSPLKLFEYMAVKRPILASDIPVLKEVLRHNENAFLVNPDDSSKWVDALCELQSSPELRNYLANQAYEEFVSEYTWEKRAKRVVAEVL